MRANERAIERAQQEGRIDGPHACEVCGMRTWSAGEARRCCRPLEPRRNLSAREIFDVRAGALTLSPADPREKEARTMRVKPPAFDTPSSPPAFASVEKGYAGDPGPTPKEFKLSSSDSAPPERPEDYPPVLVTGDPDSCFQDGANGVVHVGDVYVGPRWRWFLVEGRGRILQPHEVEPARAEMARLQAERARPKEPFTALVFGDRPIATGLYRPCVYPGDVVVGPLAEDLVTCGMAERLQGPAIAAARAAAAEREAAGG